MSVNNLAPMLRHPDLKRLYQKWVELCDNGEVPMAVDVDPADLRPWLSHMVVIKVDRDGRYVYGYYSNEYAEIFDGDRVGQSIDSLPKEQRDILKREYEQVRVEQMPVARVYTGVFDGEEQTWERLVLPFLSHDGDVEKMMVAAYRVS
ncbi:PAS domain-containing protein [Pararhodospirillum oryzae]|uniref:PAS domain-containing protein n=1 Tax=Pararhodospirillum oryzae TaxID=478448 RepID=A0A512H870_9PROT|nr:PAS domain-containing protein [Pararhodospirillum oryzae]GEO81649.1 PAS domain-containing protein [Pararhodospirillum oryzae]